MNVIIKLFGQIVDVVGSNSIQLDNISNTDELIQRLQLKYPALINSKYRVAVNRNIIQSNTALQQDTEIALLPPFSGG
jgi:molybdopterin synthase sulfur carrier subunit